MERIRIPAIIDIEASGFGRGSYPIEIGVVTESGDIFSWLIKPEKDWIHWSEEAANLHLISRDSLIEQGQSPLVIAEELNHLFEGQVLYSDGWGFDSGWLSLLFYVARTKMLFKLDTLPKVLSEFQLGHWDAAKDELRRKHNLNHHRAADDSKLLQLTFQKTAMDEQLT